MIRAEQPAREPSCGCYLLLEIRGWQERESERERKTERERERKSEHALAFLGVQKPAPACWGVGVGLHSGAAGPWQAQ